MVRFYSTFVPAHVYGKLKAVASRRRLGGVNRAAALFVEGAMRIDTLGLLAIRGLPAIEPYTGEAWIRLAMQLDEETKKAVDQATVISGLQKMFVVGVILTARADDIEAIVASVCDDTKGEQGHAEKEVAG